jgi:Na+-driven multidrug efflux pump
LWSSVHITTAYFIGSVHRPLINLWIALLATLIDIPLAYVLGSRYGAVGAAIASSLAYGTAAAVNCLAFLRLSGSSLRSVVAGVGEDLCFVRDWLKSALPGQSSKRVQSPR